MRFIPILFRITRTLKGKYMCKETRILVYSIRAGDIAILTVCAALLISLLSTPQGLVFLAFLRDILCGSNS